MSCFVCHEETFKSVAKVCFLYGLRQEERSEYPLTLDELNSFVKKVAELNCRNYAVRYDEEEVETTVTLFNDIPSFELTPQDLKSVQCWAYQTEDYMCKEELFIMVENAYTWAKSVTNFSKEEMEKAMWR